ncbi:calcium-binding protein [Shimia sagamensis]|uniref:Hemolysin-type calcium-binding repeat-containing protein n=1 Tax=Shimia sagamensis TaxID=1566352 RepID=A0ABY1PJ60_9RHOB|nr:calcium-binding protein [Shimia sagamensis]SMP35280.1 Hemolysin-type calcium-binding repeat-containing protein [Shimia sagamensis]
MHLLLLLGLAAFGGTMVFSGSESEDMDNEPETREPEEPEVVPIGPPITGTEDAENLSGTELSEQIDALAGDDVVSGLAGDDSISAGDGNDRVDGGEGNDSLLGDDGEDSLIGGAGNDSLWGGNSADTLEGGKGDDHLSGQTSDDSLYGEDGEDTLIGGRGNDTLIGGDGTDSMEGGSGNDVFWGVEDSFNEFHIVGQPHSSAQDVDTMRGDEGDDTLIMGSGDIAEGGEGADTFASGTWIDPDNLPVVEDFDVTEDVFEIHVPEWVSESGTPGSFADGTVAVDPDPDKGEGWFTVTYDGEPMASVYGPGMNISHVSVVESRYIEPEFEPSVEVL